MSKVDCKLQPETLTSRPRMSFDLTSLKRPLELLGTMLFFIGGAVFLTKMCYASLLLNIVFGLAFLSILYFYLRLRHGVKVPVVLLILVFAALQVDALGNFFSLYGHAFGPLQYDEFSHLTVQVLVTPLIIWLVRRALTRNGYDLPLKLTAFFAGSLVFSLSAAYEILELWDEVHFGGQRIWGKYDTGTDLQWDLCGIIIGTALACLTLRERSIQYRERSDRKHTLTSS
jgi:hypothetical protein